MDNNTSETATVRKIMLVDENINALKSTLLLQVKYNQILIANIEK